MFKRLLLSTAVAAALLGVRGGEAATPAPTYSHVLLISVDGMHAIDLTNFLNDPAHKNSALARLSKHGVIFQNALTTAPSDSFPGTIAQTTGGTPKSAGVFYDDSYDRTLFAPGTSCTGPAGGETQYAENIDYNSNLLNAGGKLGHPLTQIDPSKLPLSNATGTCLPVYPHQFIRVNTIFEVIKAAGMRTAWSDKHPAYEILNGPSGHGVDDLFTPEINSLIPGFTTDNTTSYTAVRNYDAIKVRAILNELHGLDSTGKHSVGVPAIMGMNFQAVSIGQKLATSGPLDPPGLTGGYTDALATPGNALTEQLAFVDASLGAMLDDLIANGLYDSTLFIVSAKHGQSPIDPSLRRALDDTPYTTQPGYAHHIGDDVAVVWLQPETRATDLGPYAKFLKENAVPLGIAQLLGADSLKLLYNDPAKDSRTPDFIAVVDHGVIYTHGTKLAEHGGFNIDDRNVVLLASAPGITPSINYTPVLTTQIAPTVLTALGLDPNQLMAVQMEGTQALPGL